MQIIKEFYLPQKINNKLHFGSLIRIFQFLVSRMKIQLFFPPPKMRVDIFFWRVGWVFNELYGSQKKEKKKEKEQRVMVVIAALRLLPTSLDIFRAWPVSF